MSKPPYRQYETTNEPVAHLLPPPPMTCNFLVPVEFDGLPWVDCWPTENDSSKETR